jgi:hypothetical protein
VATNSIFELNGKAYDALTGEMLGNANRVQHTAQISPMQPKPAPRRQYGSFDGMVTSQQTKQRRPSKPQHVAAHQPQPTKTLMRHAVKSPAPGQFQANKPASSGLQSQGALQPATPVKVTVAAKLSSDVVDPQRAHRANRVGRSHAVKHFTPVSDFRRPSATIAAPVRRAQIASPAAVAIPAATATRRTPANGVNTWNTDRPIADPRHDDDYEQDLFEQALAHASGHQETLSDDVKLPKSQKSRRKRRQVLSIVGSLGVFLILFTVIAYQNRSNIQLQLASAKAGFSASVPLYKPDGYKLGKLAYAPGSVAALYQDPSNKTFTVTQKKSNWDSQTLLENFVATSNQDYKGYQSNGRTVYVYGTGNATWVNAGIWYQIKDTGSLTNEQLVKIAASI